MKNTLFLLFVGLISRTAFAQQEAYVAPCLESLASMVAGKLPMEVIDPAGVENLKWKLTWDGKSIFRESDVKASGKQVGTSKQEIWSHRVYQISGNGTKEVAPALQVSNAQKYFLSKALFSLSKEVVTAINAKKLDKSFADCEGVTVKVSLDGEPDSKGKWMAAGDFAGTQRRKIRSTYPELFKSESRPASGTAR